MILLELFFTFFKIGLFTFGGGYAMLPLIQSETVSHGWTTEEEIINFIAVSESTPGPFAVNISTYIGMTTGGIAGAAAATLGVVLPSFLVILLVAGFYDKFKENKVVSGCMSGLKPAVVGMIGAAVLSLGQTVFFSEGVSFSALKDPAFIVSLVLFGVMLVPTFKKCHPILIICISAVIGICAGAALGL